MKGTRLVKKRGHFYFLSRFGKSLPGSFSFFKFFFTGLVLPFVLAERDKNKKKKKKNSSASAADYVAAAKRQKILHMLSKEGSALGAGKQ